MNYAQFCMSLIGLLWAFGQCIVEEVFASSQEHSSSETHGVALARWKFREYEINLTLLIFLTIVVIFRMIYHKITFISAYVPESLVLIIIGVIFGAIIDRANIINDGHDLFQLSPDVFFNYLLPPIILDSAYTLYHRTFGEYLGSILLYAVIGTIINFFIIGFAMYGLYEAGAMGLLGNIKLDIKDFLLFASLIVAVDPVAVLAIFQDIGVEFSLYYMVFGESLLNDAVTVVLYEIMIAFVPQENISAGQIAVGFFSFFTIAFGGLLIGIIFGIATCLLTRFENPGEFLLVILLAYFSYIFGNTLGWSGIIAMIGCGLVQAGYAFHNIKPKSEKVVREVTKQSAGLTESIIFLFLGVQLFSNDLVWNTGFHLWALVLCISSRTFANFFLTFLINKFRDDTQHISFTQQLIMIWGGLRGAVAFSLAALITSSTFKKNGKEIRDLIITSTLFIILVTVGFMGLTMKPLVKLLHIKLAPKAKLSLFNELNQSVIDQCMAGIEIMTGEEGSNNVREFFLRIDDKYIRKILQKNPQTHDDKILKTYEKVALRLHWASINPERSEEILKTIPDALKLKSIESYASIPAQAPPRVKRDSKINISFLGIEPPSEDTIDEDIISSNKWRTPKAYKKSQTPDEDLLDAMETKRIFIEKRQSIDSFTMRNKTDNSNTHDSMEIDDISHSSFKGTVNPSFEPDDSTKF